MLEVFMLFTGVVMLASMEYSAIAFSLGRYVYRLD